MALNFLLIVHLSSKKLTLNHCISLTGTSVENFEHHKVNIDKAWINVASCATKST